MKTTLIVSLVSVGFAAFAIAGDYKKDAEAMAKESAKRAVEFLQEAKSLEERAAKATGAEAEKIKKFADLTREEAEALTKASKAWANNQLRLAEKHQQKANELCEKRGKLAPAIYPPCDEKKACDPKAKTELDKSKPQKTELEKLHEQIEEMDKPE